MPNIAIITDFGIKDGNVGVMKGVIWGVCPDAQIADVSHMIAPQNVRESALILARSAPYFPEGTVLLLVVDPGVGTDRRPLAAQLGTRYYVGPDNGAITLWLQLARSQNLPIQFVHLDQPEYWRSEVSHVFHGRDIFAPVAGHLAAGVPLSVLGSPIQDPVLLNLPRPQRDQMGLRGEVIHIDHFGNIASNIMFDDLRENFRVPAAVEVVLGSTRIQGLVDTFGDRPRGAVIALLGSTGNLLVSVVDGNAAETLGTRVGDPIRVNTNSDAAEAPAEP